MKIKLFLIFSLFFCTLYVQAQNDWSTISAGNSHSAVIKSDGTLWIWGSNGSGQLGNGTTVSSSAPVQVGTDNTWVGVVAYNSATVALKANGTLWSWGSSYHGNTAAKTTELNPVQVGTDTNWAFCEAEESSIYAIKTNGTLWSWGDDNSGKLGRGTSTTMMLPGQVGTDTNWATVEAGLRHVLALKTTGTLWVWGKGSDGQLGVNNLLDYSSPIQLGTETTWSKISGGGYHSAALKTNGTLWTWGYAASGQLGNGSTSSVKSPVQIGTATTWAKISAGSDHTLATRTNGTLWSWGGNNYGQLGSGNFTLVSSPIQIGTDTDWNLIDTSNTHSLATKTNNFLYAFGRNNSGQLGDGTVVNKNAPTQIMTTAVTMAPTISPTISTSVTSSTATINYSLNANGSATTSIIKYGLSSSTLTLQTAGFSATGSTATAGSATLTGLAVNTLYFYKIEATNASGTTSSNIGNFNTNTAEQIIAEYNFNNTMDNINGNSPFAVNSSTFVPGRDSNSQMALQTNNLGRSAIIPNLPIGSAARTVSIWYKVTGAGTNNTLFVYGAAGGENAYGVSFDTANNWYNFAWNTNTPFSNASLDGQWHHLVTTYDSSKTSKVYVDGVLKNTVVQNGWNTSLSGNVFWLAGQFGDSSPFNGAVDDLKIYNYAISPAEVTSLYTNNSLSTANFSQNNSLVSLYPNPVNDVLHIETTAEIKSVTVYGILGNQVLSSSSKDINVSHLERGIYMVQVQDAENNISTKKIIKE